MIRLSNIRKSYQMGTVTVDALQGVSLAIDPGEFVAIMGPSGSGKSTLMHILGLLDTPDAGSYQLLGQEVARLSENELASLRGRVVGFVFQQFNLLPRTTALENAALPLLYTNNGTHGSRAKELLIDVGLEQRLLHKPNELSGGQQQKVAIARALMNDPRIIFADEPTGNLDSTSAKEIMGLLRQLNEQGITVVLVTHESDMARYAGRVIRMRDGLIQSDERTRPVVTPPPTPLMTTGDQPPAPSAHRRVAPAWLNVREMVQHGREALRALLANKVRAGLSMLGIVIGVAAVIAMLALGTGARQAIQAQLASLGSNLLVVRPGARQTGGVALEAGAVTRFTLEDANEIRHTIASVTRVAPSVSGRGQVVSANKNWNTQILGTAVEYASIHAATPVIGRFFTEEEVKKRSRVVVVGMTPGRMLFGETNPIGEFIKINRVSFQVIGILPEKGATGWRDQDDLIVIPLTTAMRRLLGKDYVDSIDVEVATAADLAFTQAAIKELLIHRHRLLPFQHDSFDIRNMADIQAALSETSRTMSWLLASIAAVSLLVGGIGIMNIMLVSVTERTGEIGLRKAVGARQWDILAQFLIEAVVISVAGGLIGILLGSGITLAMSRLAGWTAAISMTAVLVSFLSSATVGILFGLWPARQASLLNPIAALRYE